MTERSCLVSRPAPYGATAEFQSDRAESVMGASIEVHSNEKTKSVGKPETSVGVENRIITTNLEMR